MSQDKFYDAYRLAGEMFGRLREQLGFGELAMTTPTWRPSGGSSLVTFSWEFKVRGQRYCVVQSVSAMQLIQEDMLSSLAKSIATKWQSQARGFAAHERKGRAGS